MVLGLQQGPFLNAYDNKKVLKGLQFLPITSLVQATMYRLIEWFKRHGRTYEAKKDAGREFNEKVIAAIQTNSQHATHCHVIRTDWQNSLFEVKEPNDIINH